MMVESKGGGKGGKGAAANSKLPDNELNSATTFSHVAGNWMIYGPVLGCIFLITLCVLYDKFNNYMRYRHSQTASADYSHVIEASCHTLDGGVKVVHDPVTGLYVPIDPIECNVHDLGDKRQETNSSPDLIEMKTPPEQQKGLFLEEEEEGADQHIPLIEEQRKVEVRQQMSEQHTGSLRGGSPRSVEEGREATNGTLQRVGESASPAQPTKRSEKGGAGEKQRVRMVEFDGNQRGKVRSNGKSHRKPISEV